MVTITANIGKETKTETGDSMFAIVLKRGINDINKCTTLANGNLAEIMNALPNAIAGVLTEQCNDRIAEAMGVIVAEEIIKLTKRNTQRNKWGN